MIKIKLRKHLLYLFAYYISWLVNEVLETIIRYSVYIYLILSILGKIIGGLIIYIYQYYLMKKNKQSKYFGINLIDNKKNKKGKDSKIKILLLIFFASFFYVFRFIIDYQFVHYLRHSPPIDFRLSSIQTISASLICAYALGNRLKKHHKFSLIIISILLILTFTLEIIYKSVNMNLDKFIYYNLMIFYYYICETFSNCIEKYLVDINYINPFLILILEGIIQLILASIYLFLNKIDVIVKIINEYIFSPEKRNPFIICCLSIYPFISAITNVYKIYCNVIYSPMARSLIDYLLNPFFIIYTFFAINDFNKNVSHFVISIIICIIISFFGCVYNEYIILFFCGLEHETKDIISERAGNIENVPENNNCGASRNNSDNISEFFDDDNRNHSIGINDSFISLKGYKLKI